MRLLCLILVFPLLSIDSFCQQLIAIPDLTFWNTSGQYHFNLTKTPPLKLSDSGYIDANRKMEFIDLLSKELSQSYYGHSTFRGIFTFPLDTNLSSLLSKAKIHFDKQSSINVDYYDGEDSTYKLLLSYLYNATIIQDPGIAIFYLFQAKNLYNKIAISSIYRTIAYIQIDKVRREIEKKFGKSLPDNGLPIDKSSMNETDSIAIVLLGNNKYSDQNLADWNECMGDFWLEDGYLFEGSRYFINAIGYEQNYTDSASIIQIQRIREKLAYAYIRTYVGDNTFRPLAVDNLYSMLEISSPRIDDFYFHNKLVTASTDYYSNILTLEDKDTMIQDLLFEYLQLTPRTLKVDWLYFSDILRPYLLDKEYYEQARKSQILLINMIIRYNLIRRQRFDVILENSILIYKYLHKIEDAWLVNEFLGSLSINKNDYTYTKYLVNKGDLYIEKGEIDSAKKVLTKVITDNNAHYISKKKSYKLLKNIAVIENNVLNYQKYEQASSSIEDNNTEDYANIIQFLTNKNRDITQEELENRNYYLGIISDNNFTLASGEKAKRTQSDSMANIERARRMQSDSIGILHEVLNKQKLKDEEYKSRKEKLFDYRVIVFVFAFFTSVISIFYLYSQNKTIRLKAESEARKSKDEVEKKRLESEKLKFELESLRAPYLSHAIGDAFKYIINRIETGIETGDPIQFNKAKSITKASSSIFNDIILHSSEKTSLMSEVQRNEKYVNFMGDCINKTIVFKKIIDESVAEKISVPSYFLLDIYRNAIQHGQLRLKTDGQIITTLSIGKIADEFILSVEDNGIGLLEAQKSKSQDHISTGLSRVIKQLEFFNEDKCGTIISFDPQTDIIEIYDDAGKSTGTKVTFKIQKYDNS